MAVIIKNPQLQNYFVDLKYPDAIPEKSGIAPFYEDGKLIILKEYRLQVDYDFINSISWEDALEELEEKDKKIIKKLSYQNILALHPRRLTMPWQEAIYQKVFRKNRRKLAYFQGQVKQLHEQIIKLFYRLFPQYECVGIKGSWRFLPTLFENLHWDNFPNMEGIHSVRIFINLDRSHRIWHTSYLVDEFADRNYYQLNLQSLQGQNPNQLIGIIDRDILGERARGCLDDFERHSVAFERGEIWLADSRLIAHQIYHGNRTVAYLFRVKFESMDNPEKWFDRRIERLHQKYALLNQKNINSVGPWKSRPSNTDG